MIRKAPSPSANKVLVIFELPASLWVQQIHLVGDFNGWDPASHALMQRRTDGVWEITLELDAGRRYQFRYLLDDHTWCNDGCADDYVPNAYGGHNSVVVTPPFLDDVSV
ncbi:MAG: isoamylase early set domain-containing protein [Ardenticatenaceae bacterium]|nr:isoamylase early set domain-containing protein [Ardenticatenaceae bacterium]